MYLSKFLILTVMFLVAIMLQNLALAQIGMTDLPDGAFEMGTLVRFAGFLSYLADPENAQIFCDNDGAPSCITGVTSNDDGIKPMVDMINAGKTHDWMASTIDNNVTTDLYNVVQGFWANKDVDAVMKDMDASIEISSAQ